MVNMLRRGLGKKEDGGPKSIIGPTIPTGAQKLKFENNEFKGIDEKDDIFYKAFNPQGTSIL